MSVIVVGAGMAGIMAGRTLQAAGVDVIIMEARDRIGGRTWTDNALGASVDLGAAWIHGPDGNPLLPLADQYGVAYGPTDFINRSGNVVQAYDSDGTPLNMVDYTRGQMLANGAYVHAGGSELVGTQPFKAASLAEFLRDELPRPAGMNPTEAKGFHYWSTILAEYLQAADQEIIASPMHSPRWHLPGEDQLLFGGGYKQIIDQLAVGLDIRLGVAVQEIDYGARSIRVSTRAGQFSCDQVIITVPLGVLKQKRLRFVPELPAVKWAAIGRIGFGYYEKLALRFDDFYWPKDKQRFNFLSSGEPSLFNVWLNVGYYNDVPILVAYHAGRRARKINEWDDETILEKAQEAMGLMFARNGHGPIPPPAAFSRTLWQDDPFACGSYSFQQVGQQLEDRRRLAETVDNRLFFAGEATHPHYYATVHGAYESGIRAAREVLR